MFMRPTDGRIYGRKNLRTDTVKYRNNFAVQNFSFFLDLCVSESINFPLLNKQNSFSNANRTVKP